MSTKMLCLILVLVALQHLGTVPTEDLNQMEPTNPEFIGTVTPRKPEGEIYYEPEDEYVPDGKVDAEKVVGSLVSANMDTQQTHNVLTEEQAKQLVAKNACAKAAYNVYLEGKKWSRVEATLSGANDAKEFINESDKYVWTSYN